VTTIYVDQGAIVESSRSGSGADEGSLRSLGFLREAGHEVVLVVEPGHEPATAASDDWTTIDVDAVPLRPEHPAWYLTVEVDRCRGRSALLRTVLIGTSPVAAAIHRCDTLARDVPAAVLEILAAEAMRP
jgi:hypothetical protein